MVDKLDRFEILFTLPDLRYYLALNHNLTSEQVERILNDSPNHSTLAAVAKSTKLSDVQFVKVFKNSDTQLQGMSSNPNLTSEQIDLAMKHGSSNTQTSNKRLLAQYAKLNDEQFNKLYLESFDDDDDALRYYLSLNPHITHGQINTLYENEAVDRDYLAQNSNLSQKQFERLWEGDEDSQHDGGHHNYLSDNPYLTEDQIDRLMEHQNVDLEGLAAFPKLSDAQFDKLFKTSDKIKGYLAKNRNLTPDQIERLYDAYHTNNPHDDIRLRNLFQFSALTDDFFEEAITHAQGKIEAQFEGLDTGEELMEALAQNPSINPDPKEVKDWSANTGLINWGGTIWVW